MIQQFYQMLVKGALVGSSWKLNGVQVTGPETQVLILKLTLKILSSEQSWKENDPSHLPMTLLYFLWTISINYDHSQFPITLSITCTSPLWSFCPYMASGGQLMSAMTTKAEMKTTSAMQHQAARGRAPSRYFFMTMPERRMPEAEDTLWLRPPVAPTVAAFWRKWYSMYFGMKVK